MFCNMFLQKIMLTSPTGTLSSSFNGPEFAEPIVNISVAVGRDAVFTCHVRRLGGYRVNILIYYFIFIFVLIIHTFIFLC